MTSGGNITLQSLAWAGLRNLEAANFQPGPHTNLLFGNNGHGKTSVLEAIYVVCTTRSFRTPRLRELVTHGNQQFSLHATLNERRGDLPPLSRAQTAVFSERTLNVRVDGNKPRTSADYAVASPVVVFHPEEMALSTGPAELRRRLLDRVALYRMPGHARHVAEYLRALRSRQELLRAGRTNVPELQVYEQLLAERALKLTESRKIASEALFPRVLEAFKTIAAEDLTLELRYACSEHSSVATYSAQLEQDRISDARMPAPRKGPHRDDVVITLNHHPARRVASQGQHRAITLALKAAEGATVAEITGLEPIQLLDDVSSELDSDRTKALFRYLASLRGQVFVTSPRKDLLSEALVRENTLSFQVLNGTVTSA